MERFRTSVLSPCRSPCCYVQQPVASAMTAGCAIYKCCWAGRLVSRQTPKVCMHRMPALPFSVLEPFRMSVLGIQNQSDFTCWFRDR